ncbi:MAG: hypothetical protein IPK32_08490 [Verrucomicrobiaceae bacterium]|nr:hypothetical protein [Verrucomicrobiaceae bacterium]
MLKKLLPPARKQQPHYSFMQPRDFAIFILLSSMTLLMYWWAFSISGSFSTKWLSEAIFMTVVVTFYAWLRIKRRNLYADSGEVTLALVLYMGFDGFWEMLFGGENTFQIGMLVFCVPLALFSAWQITQAPRHAREMQEALEAANKVEQKRTLPSGQHIDFP